MSNLENLENYKYNCIDKSLLAKFILNPLHTKLTTYFPLTIAPNTITLLGLFCSLLSVAITIFTDPYLNDQKYPVVKLINAFLLFAYQAFDAIDGKQARRLGMSTPLGQLFDHGCDAFVCFATSITLTSSFGLGAGINLYYITICMTAVYALCSFEEYFTDIFYLGYINGPSEGIFIGVVSHIVSYFIGPKIGIMLTQEYKTMSWLMIFCIVFTVTSFVNSFIYIIRNRKRNDKAEVWNAFMCLYTLLISAFIYQFHKNAESSFYITYLTFMFVFARLTLEISYAHLKLEKIEAFDSFFYIYVVGALFGMVYEVKMVVYGMMLLIMGVNYVEFAYVTVKEVCRNLGIPCFTVKDTKKDE